jgi:antitoxin component YwqK of YwqJK toxin-antitoxin module
MRFKYLIYCISTILIWGGCTAKPEKRIIENYPTGNPKLVRYFAKENGKAKMVKEEVFYENKRIEYSGEFKDSVRNGRWVYYYENGNMWSEGFFKNGQSDGLRKTYYENGKLRYEGVYDNGKMKGTWKFYDENGNFAKEVNADTLTGQPL